MSFLKGLDEIIFRNRRLLALINGLIPLLSISYLVIFMNVVQFPLSYLIFGWTEVLMLSTFVSVVPDAASWLFYGIKLVGLEATAHLFMILFISFGSIVVLIGYWKNSNVKPKNGRFFWLIGGILTFPFGLLTLLSYYSSRDKTQNVSAITRLKGEFRKNKLPYVLITPFILFVMFTYIVPIFRGLYITFFDYLKPVDVFIPVNYDEDPLLWTLHLLFGGLGRQNPTFIGLDNYLELFSQTNKAGEFQRALSNNIYFVIIFVPLAIIVSLALAVLLNNKFLKGEDTYTTIFYMPVVTSILIVSVIWGRIVYEPRSGLLTVLVSLLEPLINDLYQIMSLFTLGMVPANTVEENVNWLSKYLMESIALMSIWRRVGFDVLILLAGLKSIPSSLYEAADIDGHGSWSKFKNITIPMLKGPIGIVLTLELINGWQIFQELYGLNLDAPDRSLALYLIKNYADPNVMTFASTVGYFIFAMTAFLNLIGRVEAKGSLKAFSVFTLLGILFSIPTNRGGILPRSLGFTINWWTYDVLFLVLAFVFLGFYLFDAIKKEEFYSDLPSLKSIGGFTIFSSFFFLLNGYNITTEGNFGSNTFTIGIFPELPIIVLGWIPLILAGYLFLTDYYKNHPSTIKVKELVVLVTLALTGILAGYISLMSFVLPFISGLNFSAGMLIESLFKILIICLIGFYVNRMILRYAFSRLEIESKERLILYLTALLSNFLILVLLSPMLLHFFFIEGPVLDISVGVLILISLLTITLSLEFISHSKFIYKLHLIVGIFFVGLFIIPEFIKSLNIALNSYIFGVIFLLIGLFMIFAERLFIFIKTDESTEMLLSFSACLLVIDNILWIFLTPILVFIPLELSSIIIGETLLLLDIFAFILLGISIVRKRHFDQSLRMATGSIFIIWSYITFITRIPLLIPIIPQLSTKYAFTGSLLNTGDVITFMANVFLNIPDITDVPLFLLSNILLSIGFLLLSRISDGRLESIWIVGVINLIGGILFSLPYFIGVSFETLNLFFIIVLLGFILKFLIVPILSIIVFYSFINPSKLLFIDKFVTKAKGKEMIKHV